VAIQPDNGLNVLIMHFMRV